MPTLKAIREGLAANLESIPGVDVSPYMLASPSLPMLWIRLSDEGIEYHEAFQDGLEGWQFLVQALVGAPTDVGAQQKLDALLDSTGNSSVKTAIESNTTLGGIVSDVTVRRCSGYAEYPLPNGTPVLGAQWTVDIEVE